LAQAATASATNANGAAGLLLVELGARRNQLYRVAKAAKHQRARSLNGCLRGNLCCRVIDPVEFVPRLYPDAPERNGVALQTEECMKRRLVRKSMF
jgi:hypothetical protein